MDVKTEYEALSAYLSKVGTEEDHQAMDELKQYVIDDEGSWALGDNFPSFISKWLNDDQPSNDDLRVKLLSVLSIAALKDDVILLLHQDRRDHVFMNYAHNIDRLPVTEQEALALFVSNRFLLLRMRSGSFVLLWGNWTFLGLPSHFQDSLDGLCSLECFPILNDSPKLRVTLGNSAGILQDLITIIIKITFL